MDQSDRTGLYLSLGLRTTYKFLLNRKLVCNLTTEGDFSGLGVVDMCSDKYPVVLMGGIATPSSVQSRGARTPISTSKVFVYEHPGKPSWCLSDNTMQTKGNEWQTV